MQLTAVSSRIEEKQIIKSGGPVSHTKGYFYYQMGVITQENRREIGVITQDNRSESYNEIKVATLSLQYCS